MQQSVADDFNLGGKNKAQQNPELVHAWKNGVQEESGLHAGRKAADAGPPAKAAGLRARDPRATGTGAPRNPHVWAAHKGRGGRALPSAPSESPCFLRSENGGGAPELPVPTPGSGPVQAALALSLLPAARLRRRGPQAAVSPPAPFPSPARRPPAYLQPGAESARAPAGPQTGPWRRRDWHTRSPRAAAGPTPGGGGLHTGRWRQRRDGGAPAPSINRRRAQNATNRRAAWPGRPRVPRAGEARTRVGRTSLGRRS